MHGASSSRRGHKLPDSPTSEKSLNCTTATIECGCLHCVKTWLSASGGLCACGTADPLGPAHESTTPMIRSLDSTQVGRCEFAQQVEGPCRVCLSLRLTIVARNSFQCNDTIRPPVDNALSPTRWGG